MPIFVERVTADNGNSETVRGIELEITSTTKADQGPDQVTIRGYWITLQEAETLAVAIGGLL